MAIKICRCCPTRITLRHSRRIGTTMYFICRDCKSRPDRIRKLFESLTTGANVLREQDKLSARGGMGDAGDLKSPGI